MKPSVIVLIVANFIPLLGVLFSGWDVHRILHLYWAENVAVGIVSVLKILTNRSGGVGRPPKIFLAGFFAVHYGFFCFGHSVFVFNALGDSPPSFGAPWEGAVTYLGSHRLLFAGFLASHLFSYFTNYLGRGEAMELSVGKVMTQPYRRIFVLHVTIIFGGMAVMMLGGSAALVAILVIVKTAGDIFFHLKEHAEADAVRTENQNRGRA